jgi:RHS repeat-associated protein
MEGNMKRKYRRYQIVACILALMIAFTNCYVPEAFAAGKDNKTAQAKEEKVQRGKSNRKTDIIIKYRDASKRNVITQNAKKMAKSGKFDQRFYFKKQKVGVYQISETDDMNGIIQELNDDPDVEYAQPNYQLNIAASPTDDKLNLQWAIYNSGQKVDGYAGRMMVDINVINAWDKTMGEDIVIGVLDTGIEINNLELRDNIYTNLEEIRGNGIDDDGNGYVDDINGWDFSNDNATVYDSASADAHGTYLSGIIAASTYNGGIAGVAPKAKILPLKFISGSVGYTSDAIEAIEYAMDMGVNIINCSFGGTDNNQALKDAMAVSGILFICASGNRGADTAEKPFYPAAFDIDNIISVSSIDSRGLIPDFASYGADVDVAAPGTSILSVAPGGSYNYYTGTSVSAAIVTGIAGLVHSYLPSGTITSVKDRILNNVTRCASLDNKVATKGRVDAYGALTGMPQADDSYIGISDVNGNYPTDGEGGADSWYITSELARNIERFHYGEGGINPSSGNYSVTCTDMSIPAPGFQVEISRTYNSRNIRQTLLGRGWTFGFEGTVTDRGDSVEISLPNGSYHVFQQEGDKYIGEGTRAAFAKNVDGVDILTTTDQYKYGFNINTGKLIYMEDKNGNRIILSYEGTKLVKVVDTIGRDYKLIYNANNLLEKVTDPAGRTVQYSYNSDNLLSKVTDPEGNTYQYTYDSSKFLANQIDQKGYTFQQLTYDHNMGNSENKVVESTDATGQTYTYEYDMGNTKTTITSKDNRKWTYWFDSYMYTIKTQDPDGKYTHTEYDYTYHNKYYGDVVAYVDRNGNRTVYEYEKIDEKSTGNVIKITNPDYGYKSNTYDNYNNVIEEINEVGNKTFYIYDSTGANLLKKVQPLNGTDDYFEGTSDVANYAITSYTYYTKSSSGCNVMGLLKTVSDPENNVTSYSYDSNGNIASVTNPAGKTTHYTYDSIGQKLTQTTAEGYKTQWNYDKNGKVLREIYPDSGIKRNVYDSTGQLLLEVSPNLYNASKDKADTNEYSGTDGTKYEWFDNGYLKSITDAEGNCTQFTWDSYGNKKTETKPNGSIYRYEYDSLNRLVKIYFKENDNSTEVLLSSTDYGVHENGNSRISTTEYTSADRSNVSVTVTVKDYADRELLVQYGDNSRVSTVYNLDGTVKEKRAANGAITYYKYNAFGNVSDIWNPITDVDGTAQFSWTGYIYDKTGNLITEMQGRPLVTNDATTEDVYTKQYNYSKGQLASETDSEGRNTSYTYDNEGRVATKSQAITTSDFKVTKMLYDFRGNPTTVIDIVRSGDLEGNDYNDNTNTELVNSYSYDKNGNILSSTDAADNVTKYTYDKLNRLLSTTKQLKDEKGTLKSEVTTSQTYTWDAQISTKTDEKGIVTRYTYDSLGQQSKMIDAFGKTTYKIYDLLGRNTAIVSPKNYKEAAALSEMDRTVFVYDAVGRVLEQRELYHKQIPNGNGALSEVWSEVTVKKYQYDSMGNVISTSDALGNTSSSTYNLAGILETLTDAETATRNYAFTVKYAYNGLGQKSKEIYQGAAYSYQYNGIGNLLRTEIDGVMKSSSTYDLAGRKISFTDALGNTTTKRWNKLNKLSKTISQGDASIDSLQTIYQYDKQGNLVYTKDSMGAINTFTYDSFGRNLSNTVKSESDNTMISVYTSYDLTGNILSKTDGNGNTTESTYDALNRNITVTNALKQTTTNTYDDNGNLISQKDYLGNVTKNVYDGINRLVETRDAYDHVVKQLEYNDADVQIVSYDALNNKTEFLYDKNLHQTGTKDAEGNTSRVVYDLRGNISEKKDANGNVTLYQYDAGNCLTKVTDALGNSTSYTYDAAGNLLTQTNGNDNTTTYKYNIANLVTLKTDPAGYAERYTYYANGKMKEKTDRNGIGTSYLYDIFGRLLTEDAGGQVQSYTYDAKGNLLIMTDGTGTTTRTYDALNRNITKDVPVIGTSIYEYDLATTGEGEYSERTTDPKGNITLKTYDKVGRLSMVTVDGRTTQHDYYNNGNRQRVRYPDGTTETYTYDKNNRITGLANTKVNDSVISTYQYTYDAAGNDLTKTESKGTTKYSYDENNRLSSVTEPEGKVTNYTYDAAGNRRSEQVEYGLVSSATIYSYDECGRLTTTISSDGNETTYLYDPNGNLASRSVGKMEIVSPDELSEVMLPEFDLIINKGDAGGTGTEMLTAYNYDNYNRLSRLKLGNSTTIYSYNAQGYRVEKKANSKTTRYLYEYDKVVLETDESNNQTAYQVYGTNLLYRSITGEAGSETQSYYYLYNAHGDVTSLLDMSGSIAVSYDYDAFGNIKGQTGTVDNPIRYAGYQYDEESGLYYLNARYYDSVTARFISEDTYLGQANDPLSLNLYTYCVNNPVKFLDPSGHNHVTDEYKNQSRNYNLTHNGVIVTVTEEVYNHFRTLGWKEYYGEALDYNSIFIAGNINTVNTSDNTHRIDNYGKVNNLDLVDESILTINNLGYINQISTGSKSTTVVNNLGYIESISSGTNSNTYITNSGNIGEINNSEKSYMSIDNFGYIGNINNNSRRSIDIGLDKKGSIQQVNGRVTWEEYEDTVSRRFLNSININMMNWGASLEDDYNLFIDFLGGGENGIAFVEEQANNIISVLQMSGVDIIKSTGESLNAWINRFNSASDLEKIDMFSDITAEGIRVYAFTVAGSQLTNAIQGASKTAIDINKLNSKPLYRVMTESELNAVKDTGYLRGGREGTTYFTDSYYKNASNAQNRLSLPNEPEYIVEFKITNNPTVTGGNTVKPAYGGSGGGREYFSENPVQIDIINYQKMK